MAVIAPGLIESRSPRRFWFMAPAACRCSSAASSEASRPMRLAVAAAWRRTAEVCSRTKSDSFSSIGLDGCLVRWLNCSSMETVYQKELSMANNGKWDLARQVATVVGALFQVLAPVIVPIGAIAKETPSLVIPADYAFAIWGPFLLCLAYATYQALPANGKNPLLQRVGWFLAGAFFLNGLWEVLVPLRQPVVLQAILAGIFACLAVGYVRLVRSDRSVWNRVDRWLVALPLGLLFGWITAANVVSFNDTLVELGLSGSGVGGALAGAFLLLVGAVLASVVILVSGAGPLQSLLAYAGAVLWAPTGVVVNQYDASLLTTGAALLSGALVAIAIINTLRGRRPHIGASRSVRPEAAGGEADSFSPWTNFF